MVASSDCLSLGVASVWRKAFWAGATFCCERRHRRHGATAASCKALQRRAARAAQRTALTSLKGICAPNQRHIHIVPVALNIPRATSTVA